MVFLGLLISIYTGFYLMVALFLFVGSLLSGRASNSEIPTVSVIIPARNEEERIENCLRSILNQDYPEDLLEVVVVNDRSTDRTGQIVREIASRDERVRAVDVHHKPPDLTGKQNALDEGLRFCGGEIILNTDADCTVSPNWVRGMVSHFGDGVGMAIGFTLVRSDGFSLRDRILSMDMLFLLNAAAGAAGLGVPVSCIGNNIAYRSVLIRKLGGFSGLGKTITEDAELIQAIRRSTDWKVETAYGPETVVYTLPIRGIRGFLNQRARWMMGGFETRAWTVLPLVPILILHISIVVGFVLSILWRPLLWISSAAFGVKFLADFILTLPGALRLKKANLLFLMPIYEPLLLIYPVLVLLYAVFIGEIRWKGDIYRR
jgi:cellulose synthase/poly-beta-1,6-N-acetylglucosamine synthase-like glycosyltransferase